MVDAATSREGFGKLSFPSAAAKSAPAFSRLKTFLLFLVLGPPVGGILTFLALIYLNGYFSRFEPRFIWRGIAWLPTVVSASYILAAVPAALTGFLVARLRGQSSKPVWRNMLRFAAIGAVLTDLFASCVLFIIRVVKGGSVNFSVLDTHTFLAGIGAISSMFCGYIALRASWLTLPNGAGAQIEGANEQR